MRCSFKNIQHYNLVSEKDGYSLVIYLDPSLEEFGGELGEVTKNRGTLVQQIQHLVKTQFPKLKIKSARVMAGGILLTTISMNPALFNNRAEAASYSPSDPVIEYIVQPGDSLSVIAKKYGTTVDELMETNDLDSTLIRVGERLHIPTQADKTEPTENISTPEAKEITYKVVGGDSLSKIAKRFNTTVQNIKKLNNLTSDTIYVGQTLKISEKTPTTINEPIVAPSTYTVVRGDALSKIAQRFNTTVSAIKQLNQLTSDTIYVGQTLKIPGSGAKPTVPPIDGEKVPTEQTVETSTYSVVKGDTLSKLAKQFDTTVDAIKQVNQLSSNTIYIGQKLQIPSSQKDIVEQDVTAPTQPSLNNIVPVNFANQNNYVIS